MTDLNPPEHAAAFAAESMLGAPHGLRHVSGSQFGPVYHGTAYNWKTPTGVSHDAPLHVDTDKKDFPQEMAFNEVYGGGSESDSWEAMHRGRVKEFRFKPEARVHVTQTGHADGILPDAEHEAVKRGGYDATMFVTQRGTSHLGTIYNADAIEHVKDHTFKDVTGSNPEDEMDNIHGEDWRDWV